MKMKSFYKNVHIIYKVPYYDRSEVYEGIDVNKASASKECVICYYRYFLHKGIRFQPIVCNNYHDY